MKRISVLTIVVLTILAGAAEARIYYPVRHRVRWSMYTHSLIAGDVYYNPYTLRPGHSGLVRGDVYYSPYANKPGHSGLVSGNVRYSIYARGNKHSGLVADPWGLLSCYPYSPYHGVCHHSVATGCSTCSSSCAVSHKSSNLARAQTSRKERLEARKERIRTLRQAREQVYTTGQTGGSGIICDYLKNKKIDFRTSRTLQIEGKTISVDFLLKDRKIIKYWNPVEILALEQQPDYKRKVYERYLKSWADFCGKYQKSGGKIYQIITADTEEILAQLTLFHEQNGEKVYALSQTPP